MSAKRPSGWILGLAVAGLLAFSGASPVLAQFLPPDFFADLPDPGKPAQVEADTLGYDEINDVISAEGRVALQYGGYTLHCDDLRYEQGSGALVCEGNVEIDDGRGSIYRADRIEVTKGMKTAVLDSLTLTTSDGAVIRADDVRFAKELGTILDNASYSPCGDCIDKKGHRIGWQVKAVRMTQDEKTRTVSFEQPKLELLGVPVAWLPFLSVPDPSDPRRTGFQLPTVDYKAEIGARVTLPYFMAVGADTDLLFTPALMSRQGLLLGGQWRQRFATGSVTTRAWGLWQADPGAFSGKLGDRDWRGAFRSAAEFSIAPEWSAGWNYTAFSDAAFLGDYALDTGGATVNEVHLTQLSRMSHWDLRLSDFQRLGDVSASSQRQEADVLPALRGSTLIDLGTNGQVRLSTTAENLHRSEAEPGTYGAVPYSFGFAGDKLHVVASASWQKQMIAPGGLVTTPYLEIRLDGARYDPGTALEDNEPVDQTLFSATPIAAVDVRYPLALTAPGSVSVLFEPIGQLIYRGSATTTPGITNDNAHSFVFDDTNLFALDRMSGTDRQDTGLRANIGFRTLATVGSEGWVEFVAGQSFHLSGVNSFAAADQMQLDERSGLEGTASPVVLAARGSPGGGLTVGGKAQVDLANVDAPLPRAGAGFQWQVDDYALGADFIHLAKNVGAGIVDDQTEVTVSGGAPLPIDYWHLKGSLSWDIAQNKWLQSTADLVYDDGYLEFGGYATATGPTNSTPDKVVIGAKFRLKGPGGDAQN